ncbi:MAG: Uma2 family endonuclease [Chloroflexota bacterium]|nr:Uma2 family endonuclease [Chloroflexota bacterium]
MVTAVEIPTLQLILVGQDPPLDLDGLQGLWSEAQYLRLTDSTSRLIEFTDGQLEVLPMPTDKHQAIIEELLELLRAFIRPRGGVARSSALRMRVRPGKYREPDLLALRDRTDPRRGNRLWHGADVVMEVVSPDNPERDTQEKRQDYAEGGVPEYWIVNPQDATITVLELVGESYVEHGVFGRGATADSVVLPGFAVAVDTVLDAD